MAERENSLEALYMSYFAPVVEIVWIISVVDVVVIVGIFVVLFFGLGF